MHATDIRERVVEDYFRTWIDKDDSCLQHIFSPDAVYIESWGPSYRGYHDIQRWFREWNVCNSVLRWDITRFYHQDDSSVCEWKFACVCEGKVSAFDGVSIVRFNGDSKIIWLKEYQSKTPNVFPYEGER